MAKRDVRSLTAGPHRLHTLLAVVVLGFVALAVRLFTMQVVEHAQYAQFARDNQLQRERIPGPRGFMRDRNGHIIVDNAPHFTVVMQWRSRNEVAETVRDLAVYIPIDTSRAMARFDAWQKRYGRMAFPLFPDADKFVVSFVRENWRQYPKLKVETRLRRRYPRQGIAAHVFGYVGEVTGADVAAGPEGVYVPGDFLGKAGLERQYEDVLRGTAGQRAMEVTATGTSLGEITELSIPSTPGHDLYLTIDYHMQRHLDSLLALRPNPSAAVVLDVRTGGIIAATSRPAYDPNEFAAGVSPSLLNDLLGAETKPMFNRISHARYPPASTFKIVVAYAVLTNRIVDPARVLVYCKGGHRFGTRVFKCWKEEGHGAMNLTSAIVHSCDVYFYRIGEMMDVDVLASASAAFGFDEKTGIDLPIEVPGNVPTRRYYDKRHGKGRWTQGLMLNNVIGQGEYLSTVLHVARMSAAVANGGWVVEPHFLDHVAGEAPPAWPKTRIENMDSETLAFLERAMTLVTEQPGGTAYWLRIPWLPFASKTGTAQNPHGDHHSWFTAYAPADDPEIAIALIVENAGHGSQVAGPIVKSFLMEYFRARNPALQKLSSLDGRPGAGPDVANRVPMRGFTARPDSALAAGGNR